MERYHVIVNTKHYQEQQIYTNTKFFLKPAFIINSMTDYSIYHISHKIIKHPKKADTTTLHKILKPQTSNPQIVRSGGFNPVAISTY